jgi:hypothetical protein
MFLAFRIERDRKLEPIHYSVGASNHKHTPGVELTGPTVPQEQEVALKKRTYQNPNDTWSSLLAKRSDRNDPNERRRRPRGG